MLFDFASAPLLLVEVNEEPQISNNWTNIAADAPILSIKTQRGRSQEFDRVQPGSCTIVIDNADGRYDPDLGTGLISATPNVYPWPQFGSGGTHVLPDTLTGTYSTAPNFPSSSTWLNMVYTSSTASFTWSQTAARTALSNPGTPLCFTGQVFQSGSDSLQVNFIYRNAAGTVISDTPVGTTSIRNRWGAWCTMYALHVPPVDAVSVTPKITMTRAPASSSSNLYFDGWRMRYGWWNIRDNINTRTLMTPGRHIRVSAFPSTSDQTARDVIWQGRIEDVESDIGDQPTVTLTCKEYIADLANAYIPKVSSGVTYSTYAARANDLGAKVWNNANRGQPVVSCYPSTVIPGATTYDGYALDLLQLVADSDQGIVYQDGETVFVALANTLRAQWSSASVAVEFNDNYAANTIQYKGLRTSSGMSKIRNFITAKLEIGGETAEHDDTSIDNYGQRDLQVTTCNRNTAEAYFLCVDMIARHKDPYRRIDAVEVDLTAQPLINFEIVLGTGLWQKARVSRHFAGLTLTQDGLIQGIEHDITPDRWGMTMYLQKPFT